jgi:Mce-associated membrane protein
VTFGNVKRGPLILAWALSVLLVVALAGGTLSVIALQRQSENKDGRDGAMKAGRQTALDFTTSDYKTWDEYSQRVLADTTGQFKDEFQAAINASKEVAQTNQATSKGDVKEAAVVSSDKDSAQVLVIVDAVVVNTSKPNGELRRYRLKLDLVREKDRWLTADLQFVG